MIALRTIRVRAPRRGLHGILRVPGDKSIGHRALLLGGWADGRTVVRNFSGGGDNLSTLEALRLLGVEARFRPQQRTVVLESPGARGFHEPEQVIDCGNSGTTARLLAGVLSGRPFFTVLTGDASLRSRPMHRVVAPLRRMGARIEGRSEGDRLPLAFLGGDGGPLRGARHRLPVASAQLKSALLLAALEARGVTEIEEPALSRDHTERMLPLFGGRLERQEGRIRIEGGQFLHGADAYVPGDLSSAAFFLVAAALVPGSDVTVREVGLNPTRTGVLDALKGMGADLEVHPGKGTSEDPEPRGSVRVRSRSLRGLEVPPDWVPRTIDEFPILVVAAAVAEGTTVIRGARELRVKETDRIQVLCDELGRMGARLEALPDGIRVEGPPRGGRLKGARVSSHGDHRIAMSLAVAGLLARGETLVQDNGSVQTSFPGFEATFRKLM